MGKFGAVIIVVVVVALGYLAMLLYMSAINSIIQSVNATITISGVDITAMPGSQSGLLAIPWILWFVPGVLGMVIVVMILKKPS